jgi:hypothetical protein
LGLGGSKADKESARLDSSVNEKAHSNKEKENGLQARVGEASCMAGTMRVVQKGMVWQVRNWYYGLGRIPLFVSF